MAGLGSEALPADGIGSSRLVCGAASLSLRHRPACHADVFRRTRSHVSEAPSRVVAPDGEPALARTQAADYEDQRAAIVEQAADLFARLGFQATSVSSLSAACKTSKSLFYHYYPSKEDVLYAVMASHIDQVVADVEAVNADEKPPRHRLADLVHSFMRHYVGAANRQKVLLNELGSLPEDKRSIIVKKQKWIVDSVRDILIGVNPRLGDDMAKARVEAMLLFGMLNWTHTWFDPSGPVAAKTVADMVLDHMRFRPGK